LIILPDLLSDLPGERHSPNRRQEIFVSDCSINKKSVMVKFALLVRLEAKAGKEKELAEFLKSALPLVQEEPNTVHWFGLQLGPSTFGIFDTFESNEGRQAHLAGKVAAALMAKAPELLAQQPVIESVDLLAVDIK
jgi:quinol monooxygenase YgiN